MSLKRKDLLGIQDLTVEEIQLVLETAESFKEVTGREIKKVPTLRGKTVVNLFFEPSTRTRTSFELAAKRLRAEHPGPAAAGLGHQRRGRRTRTPDAGPSGPLHVARKEARVQGTASGD